MSTQGTSPQDELTKMFAEVAAQNHKREETIKVLKEILNFEKEIGEDDPALSEQITQQEMKAQSIKLALERRGYR